MTCLLVGIGGCSSAGKSTLSKEFVSMISSSSVHSFIISQDTFFKPTHEIPFDPVREEEDWDCPEAYNMEIFISHLQDVKLNPSNFCSNCLHSTQSPVDHIVLVEGILLFQDPEIFKILDYRFFLEVPFEIAKNRRENRVYQTELGEWKDPPFYFEKIVWVNYLKYNDFEKWKNLLDSNIHFLNGEEKPRINSQKIFKLIQERLQINVL